jgi:MscS family membrane protein
MLDFFEKQFFGNTVAEWLLALLFIVGSFITAKIVYWISGNIIKRITKKTKSQLDDLIINQVENPIVMAIVIAGFWFGFEFLNLSDGFNKFINKAFYVAVTFDVSWMIVRLIDAIIIQYLTPQLKKPDKESDSHLLLIVRKSIKVAIWTIAVIVGLNNAGYDVGALIAGLGLGGLAFAMAAKDSVANLFGGISVFIDKPFKIGDRIQIDIYDGFIIDIGLRSTKLKTLNGRIVTIPNHKFTDSFIENVTSEPSRKIILYLGLVYQTPVKKVHEAIEILKDIDKTSKYTEENCIVFFETFGEFSIKINFTYFIKSEPDYWFLAPNDINLEILNRFNEAGLEFAFPTQTIFTQKN